MRTFDKYQGLGNDFIVIEEEAPEGLTAERARQLCDRHFGIGADGVLVVSPSERADSKLVILNADGSRPEMCGNGLRCVALHLQRRHGGRERFRVETDFGVRDCTFVTRRGEPWIQISLGTARVLEQPLTLEVAGERKTFVRVSVGNPHAVLLGHDYDTRTIDELGPLVSARIEGGANVEFVKIRGNDALDVIVWERGVGRTLACGTGAGAAVVAAAQLGVVGFDASVAVSLPGGALEVRARRSDLDVTLVGPAAHVFRGELPG